jgi:hypothetical protein
MVSIENVPPKSRRDRRYCPENANSRGDIGTAAVARLACSLLLAAGLVPAGVGAQEPLDDARAILNAMSDYVSGQQTIMLTFDSDIEVITPELEKIQFTNSGDALVQRPDKLRAHRVGGYAEIELYYDGTTVSVDGRSRNAYAQFEAPGTLDDLIHALRAGHGVALPGADLLLSSSYNVLIADVLEAKHIGRGVIDGVECEHLAFRNADVDWQIWVEVGERPIPRKLVITSKTLNSAPQYTLRIKSWQTDVEPEPGAFTFTPPEGAERIRPDALIDLDELPKGKPTGGME